MLSAGYIESDCICVTAVLCDDMPARAPDAHALCRSPAMGDGIRSAAEAEAYIRSLKFSGMTALGTAIETRVIEPFVVQPAQRHALSKPVLVRAIALAYPSATSQVTHLNQDRLQHSHAGQESRARIAPARNTCSSPAQTAGSQHSCCIE